MLFKNLYIGFSEHKTFTIPNKSRSVGKVRAKCLEFLFQARAQWEISESKRGRQENAMAHDGVGAAYICWTWWAVRHLERNRKEESAMQALVT